MGAVTRSGRDRGGDLSEEGLRVSWAVWSVKVEARESEEGFYGFGCLYGVSRVANVDILL